ncbi:muscarinic acetylcholine receptor M2-like [Apostichopus japonicus]|uniref:muscarinic acetylcholine receptor M2-like n=1 Tax=Stichopus japonicus TaxID=307972 RepID=UPI003AB7BA4E
MESESSESVDVDILYVVIYGCLAIVTIGGNSLVISAFYVDRKIRQKVSNYFILHLAIADLLGGCFVLTIKFGKSFWSLLYPTEEGNWPLGETACIVWLAGGTTLIYVSTLIVIAISFDRYLLVRDAIKYTINVTKNKILITIAIVWTFSVIYSFGTTVAKFYIDIVLEELTGNTSSHFSPDLEFIDPFIDQEANFTTLNPTTVENVESSMTNVNISPSFCSDDVYSSVKNSSIYVPSDFLLFFIFLATINGCVCFKLTQRARNGIFNPTSTGHRYKVRDDTGTGDSPKNNVGHKTDTEQHSRETSLNSDHRHPIVVYEDAETDPKKDIESKTEFIEAKYDNQGADVVSDQEDTTKENSDSSEKIFKKIRDCKKNPVNRNRGIQLHKSRKAVKALTTLVIVYVICWCPYYVISGLYHSDVINVPEFVLHICLDMIWLNSAINPFLYGITNVRFKRGMVLVWKKLF